MINKNVKTLFIGKVGIHQKYIQAAVQRKEDLCLKYEEESMIIPWQEVEKKGKIGDEVHLDKFNGNYYRLVYFNWRPSIVQKKLI